MSVASWVGIFAICAAMVWLIYPALRKFVPDDDATYFCILIPKQNKDWERVSIATTRFVDWTHRAAAQFKSVGPPFVVGKGLQNSRDFYILWIRGGTATKALFDGDSGLKSRNAVWEIRGLPDLVHHAISVPGEVDLNNTRYFQFGTRHSMGRLLSVSKGALNFS